jgi:molybdenum cofactor guanylyltransferase
MIERTDITGLILCGGAGSRFDGRDKPLEDLCGATLVAHVRERLQTQVGPIVISCNRNFDAYACWGDPTVPDAQPGRGPLEGILAGMNTAATDYVFACPGDAPFLPTDLVERLTTVLCRNDAEIATPHDGTQRQHLFMLVRRSLAPALREYLDTGGRSARGFFDMRRGATVDVALEAAAFVNVNRSADLQAAAELQRRIQQNT